MNKKYSNNVLSADNQQERLKQISPWYIVGFVEGEGTFHLALYKDSKMKQGIKIIPEFHVNQSYLRIETLKVIQEYFKCGYLKQNNIKHEKDDTFELFKRIVSLMGEGKHLTKRGTRQIVELSYRMNQGGKYRKTNKQDLLI